MVSRCFSRDADRKEGLRDGNRDDGPGVPVGRLGRRQVDRTGGNLINVDDPSKPDDANSEVKRNAVNEWYRNTSLSRLDDKRIGAIVIVMQRVHMDDLTGFVNDQSEAWTIPNLPAIAEFDEIIPTSQTTACCRKAGEPLSPGREPLWVLENLKKQLGGDSFSAQYQQAPAPPGGAMIRRQ
jgi:hypothetical protein